MRLGVLLALLAVFATAAFVDHRHTLGVSRGASSDSWWCIHKAVRCTRFDADAYHAWWEWRERGYEAGGALLAGAVVLVGARRLRLRL